MRVQVTGEGEPLVLVGGGLTGWKSWEPHAERLAEGRRIARLQPLNVQYGLEDRPLPEEYSVRYESAALAAALDDLGWHGPSADWWTLFYFRVQLHVVLPQTRLPYPQEFCEQTLALVREAGLREAVSAGRGSSFDRTNQPCNACMA